MHDFSPLNNFFDKIYILTLPSLQQRMETVAERLKGLNYEFFFGIDKGQTSLPELKEQGLYSTALYREFYNKPAEMSLGMVCCSLGHVKMYQSIIAKGFKKTLILEDDVVPIIEHLHLFSAIMAELPQYWELLYLGYEKNEEFGWKQRLKKWVYTTWPNHAQLHLSRAMYKKYYPRKFSSHIYHAGFHDCTHAYAVTLDGASKLLELQQPVAFNPDNLLAWANCTSLVNAFITRPKLFNQLSAFVDKIPSLTGD